MIIVTGSCGRVGKAVCRELEVHGLDWQGVDIVHRRRPIVATQFHPEAADRYDHQSIEGLRIVRNFLGLCERGEPNAMGSPARWSTRNEKRRAIPGAGRR